MNNFFQVIKDEFRWHRVIKYIIGMILIALGVVFTLRSDLGNSTWDTFHFALHKWANITIGTAIILVALAVIVAVIVINKQFKYIFMAIPVFLVGPLVDFFDLIVFHNLIPDTFMEQLLLFLMGLIFLPLGGALLIISTYPAGVFDELMYSIMRVTKTNDIIKVRVIMEVTAVSMAFIMGLLAGIGRGKIYYGTLVFALSMGPIIKLLLKGLERIGLSETKQND
jgi:uncharacterized membrane protein YczE